MLTLMQVVYIRDTIIKGGKMKDYKAKRRKLFHTQESLELLKTKKKETMQESLDRVGYKSKEEYKDCVSYLAW